MANLKSRRYFLDVLLVLIILFLLPFFFYKLGQSSLTSFDEAWYAAIANNLLKEGDVLRLFFNGNPFVDHPPFGIWMISLSFKLFGVSNFTARFSQALFGLLTLVTIYFLGKEMFSRKVGFFSSISLTSSYWFIYRARSGNLDIFLVFFMYLSILLAYEIRKTGKLNVSPLLVASLACLFLTKTAVPFAIIPLIVYLLSFGRARVNIFKTFLIIVLSAIPLLVWYLVQRTGSSFILDRFCRVAFPGIEKGTSVIQNLLLLKTYLRLGIGNWFWWGMFSVFVGLVIRWKKFLPVFIFTVSFLIPFTLSNRFQIPHLIPVYPIIIISLFGLVDILGESVNTKSFLVFFAMLCIFSAIAIPQLKRSWYEFIDIPAYISDEQILSEEASKYSEMLIIDDEYLPAAVFYSGKDVNKIAKGIGKLKEFFDGNHNFILITSPWRLEEEKISVKTYRIIKKDRDKVLIQKI